MLDLQNPDNIDLTASAADFQQWINTAISCASSQATDTSAQPSAAFDITVRVVSNDEAKQLNSTYRNKDYATNVLSFPFEAPEGVQVNLLGDIVICSSVVNKEAQEQHKTAQSHWAHLTIHGTLHLLGFDHIDDNDAHEMEAIEVNAMAKLGFPDPYQDQLSNT
ncbi:MAG: rRNA maturation RNase YbeY [Moraxellaceae bacterium]|nr:MAG: rRNA maturation RNase YbeY [Moraxellaceae bacterium]